MPFINLFTEFSDVIRDIDNSGYTWLGWSMVCQFQSENEREAEEQPLPLPLPLATQVNKIYKYEPRMKWIFLKSLKK